MNKLSIVLCSVLGTLLLIPAVGYVYLRYGHPPVAVTDTPFPNEAQIVHIPLNARIARDMPKSVPFQPTEAVYVDGAHLYAQHCAICHGIPNQKSSFGPHEYPSAPQLWTSHHAGVVGVSDDPVGETYWKVKNGIRLTGMPAYATILSEKEMWDVSLLMANADKPLSPAVQSQLASR